MINQTKVESTKSDKQKIREAGRKLSNTANYLILLILLSALFILFVLTGGTTNDISLYIFGGIQFIVSIKLYQSLSNAGILLEKVGDDEDKN